MAARYMFGSEMQTRILLLPVSKNGFVSEPQDAPVTIWCFDVWCFDRLDLTKKAHRAKCKLRALHRLLSVTPRNRNQYFTAVALRQERGIVVSGYQTGRRKHYYHILPLHPQQTLESQCC